MENIKNIKSSGVHAENKNTGSPAKVGMNCLVINCPKCKGVSGYYMNFVTSYAQFMNWNNEPIGTTDIMHARGGKRKFCADCHKDITAFVDEQISKGNL